MISKTIKVHNPGPAESMKWEDVEIPFPSRENITIKHSYVGLNYIDTYHRSGLYPLPLPATIGMEGAGEVVEVGDNTSLKKGDRVVYALGPPGSYSSLRNIPENKVIKIPDYIDDKSAAAIMLKGMTVEYLTERTFPVNNNHTVLFHAISGGVGQIATQWIKNKGAKIISTPVYRSVPSGRDNSFLLNNLDQANIDWTIFASPSAVENFHKFLPDGYWDNLEVKPKIACIGETTELSVKSLGWNVELRPAIQDFEHLVKALCEKHQKN